MNSKQIQRIHSPHAGYRWAGIGVLLTLLSLSACGMGETPAQPNPSPTQAGITIPQASHPQPSVEAEPSEETPMLKITVGDKELLATFETNSSAEEFRQLLAQGSLTIEMVDYGGFEKVGPLGTTLTRNDTPITAQPGDVILYQGNQITIYYGTNSWSFTKLATIQTPVDWKAALGKGAISVTFSLT